jgi:hypothetical protein
MKKHSSHLENIKSGCEAHHVTCSVGNKGHFPEGKVVRFRGRPLTSI